MAETRRKINRTGISAGQLVAQGAKGASTEKKKKGNQEQIAANRGLNRVEQRMANNKKKMVQPGLTAGGLGRTLFQGGELAEKNGKQF